jgi:predicted MFS family arabinose efflux permease
MMNKYIIEPSSAYYAEALGSSDALSGLMIGMAPSFTLSSSVGYSYWTNHSYKRRILFAGVLQCVGNLMYANAFAYGSVEMCLLGRAITGLGAPRIINRR